MCKYYDNNEIINSQLFRIKSAATVRDFERIFNEQSRNRQFISKSAKSVEKYYDTKTILTTSPLIPFTSEACLCTRDFYRLDYAAVKLKEHQQKSIVANSQNLIKNFTSSFDNFLDLASDCYINCIQSYLVNLNECDRRAEVLERRQSSNIYETNSLKTNQINENLLINQFNRLDINLSTRSDNLTSQNKSHNCRRQSNNCNRSSFQVMSCNDTNNNCTDSTNQLKDPPKIIVTTLKQSTHQSDSENSDISTGLDKNSLTIPITNYCSEARPP